MPAKRDLRHTTASDSGPRTTTTTSLDGSTVPNSSTSVPTKPVVIWIWCSERSAISGVWPKPGTARAMMATDRRTACSLISMPPFGADGEEVGGGRHQIEQQLAADQQHQRRQQDAQLLAAQADAGAGADLRADHGAGQPDEGEEDRKSKRLNSSP